MIFVFSLLSAIIGGMGIGGGVVLIPALTMFFDVAQRQAQYMNLIYFVPLSICALFVHKKEGNLEIKKAVFMAIGGSVGAIFGSYLAFWLKIKLLRRLFGAFLFVIGLMQLKNTKET